MIIDCNRWSMVIYEPLKHIHNILKKYKKKTKEGHDATIDLKK